MNERELRAALRGAPVDEQARARSWRVVRAAYRAAPPHGRRARSRRRWIGAAVAACVALALAAGAATRAPTDALAQWLRDVVGADDGGARRVLGAVPGGGRLLVGAQSGAWVVAPDGAKRRLGRYEGASWSPHGRFAVAWRGGELTALEPDGDVRWSLRRPAPVRVARWAPGDGYRIAYLAGSTLRIVNGDGTGDRRLAAARAGVAPAWRPGPGHVLAYADPAGRVRVADVDSGRELSQGPPYPRLRGLAFSPDGSALLVRLDHALVWLGRDGAWRAERSMPAGAVATAAAWSPGGAVALLTRDRAANRSEVVLLDAPEDRGRVLFTAPGALGPIAFSPDGRLLLVAWPDADQWLFLAPERRRRPVRAVADVAAQFAPGALRAGSPTAVEWTGPPEP